MKFAIISDTHGNSATFAKFADWVKKNSIQEIIHCGDIGFVDFTKEMCASLSGIKFHLVIGNMDTDADLIGNLSTKGGLPNAIFYGDIGKMVIGNKKIAFTHKPEEAKILAESGQFDLVFFGHTHRPWEEKIVACRLVNPGELAGQINRPSFAIYDTKDDKLELKILDLIFK